MPKELAIAYVNDVSAPDNPFILVEGSVKLVNTTMLPGMDFPDMLPNTNSISQGFACDASMWPDEAFASAQYTTAMPLTGLPTDFTVQFNFEIHTGGMNMGMAFPHGGPAMADFSIASWPFNFADRYTGVNYLSRHAHAPPAPPPSPPSPPSPTPSPSPPSPPSPPYPPSRWDFELFKSGQAGMSCYRVPVLIATDPLPPATQPRLLAFTEARLPVPGADHCNVTTPSRLALRVSADAGQSWGRTVWLTAPPPVNSTGTNVNLGSATMHRASGTLFVHYVSGYHPGGNPKVYYIKSSNVGETWHPAVDITASAPKWFVPGPGNGVDLGNRLVVCGRTLTGVSTPSWVSAGAVCLLSDDGGASWRSGDPVPAPAPVAGGSAVHPGENEAVALGDGGRMLLSMRDEGGSGRRLQAVSTDGGQSWGDAQVAGEFPDPGCEGSLARVDASRIALSSDHSAARRTNLTVAVSADGGASWAPLLADVGRGNDTEYSAMATIPGLPELMMGMLYETKFPDETNLTVHFAALSVPPASRQRALGPTAPSSCTAALGRLLDEKRKMAAELAEKDMVISELRSAKAAAEAELARYLYQQ